MHSKHYQIVLNDKEEQHVLLSEDYRLYRFWQNFLHWKCSKATSYDRILLPRLRFWRKINPLKIHFGLLQILKVIKEKPNENFNTKNQSNHSTFKYIHQFNFLLKKFPH